MLSKHQRAKTIDSAQISHLQQCFNRASDFDDSKAFPDEPDQENRPKSGTQVDQRRNSGFNRNGPRMPLAEVPLLAAPSSQASTSIILGRIMTSVDRASLSPLSPNFDHIKACIGDAERLDFIADNWNMFLTPSSAVQSESSPSKSDQRQPSMTLLALQLAYETYEFQQRCLDLSLRKPLSRSDSFVIYADDQQQQHQQSSNPVDPLPTLSKAIPEVETDSPEVPDPSLKPTASSRLSTPLKRKRAVAIEQLGRIWQAHLSIFSPVRGSKRNRIHADQ